MKKIIGFIKDWVPDGKGYMAGKDGSIYDGYFKAGIFQGET